MGHREEKKFYLLGGRGDGFKGEYKTQMCRHVNPDVGKHLACGRCVNMLFHGLILPLGEPGYSTGIHEEDLESPLSFTKTVGGKPGGYNTDTGIKSVSQSKPF